MEPLGSVNWSGEAGRVDLCRQGDGEGKQASRRANKGVVSLISQFKTRMCVFHDVGMSLLILTAILVQAPPPVAMPWR